jgi:hypothetical protein
VTGEQVLPTGSAEDAGAAIEPWDEGRRQVAERRLPARPWIICSISGWAATRSAVRWLVVNPLDGHASAAAAFTARPPRLRRWLGYERKTIMRGFTVVIVQGWWWSLCVDGESDHGRSWHFVRSVVRSKSCG